MDLVLPQVLVGTSAIQMRCRPGGGEETGGPTTLLVQLSHFLFFSFDYSDNNVTDDIKQGSIITYQLVV